MQLRKMRLDLVIIFYSGFFWHLLRPNWPIIWGTVSRLSAEFEIDDIFLRKKRFVDVEVFFKDTLCCLEKIKDLNAKAAKRGVKMCATNARVFPEIFCFTMLLKICLVHTFLTRNVQRLSSHYYRSTAFINVEQSLKISRKMCILL